MPYPHLTEDEMSRATREELYGWCRKLKQDVVAAKSLHAECQEELERMRNPKVTEDDEKDSKGKHHK